MAYGWEAWKNKSKQPLAEGRSRSAKERGYMRGFREAAKELGLDPGGAICPGAILDDPGIDGAGAFDLGRYDANQIARRKTA